MVDGGDVMDRVRKALGRRGQLKMPGELPPALPDDFVRLVRRDATDLASIFAARGAEMKMKVTTAPAAQVVAGILTFLKGHPIKRVALSVSPLLEQLKLRDAIRRGGFEVKTWDQMTLDELYDFDCAITDVHCAVAEAGALVVKPSAAHGRGLSLVPMYHIALVQPQQIMADMVDLFEFLAKDPDRSNIIMITGPSKTADIEMNVVTGVHGPNVVNVFVVK